MTAPATAQSVWSREDQRTPICRSGEAYIASGESLSAAYVTDMAPFVAVHLPALTSAAISFQVQAEPGGAFVDLYNSSGEVSIGASTGSRARQIPELGGWYAFKIRSGLSGATVNQGAARTIKVQCSDRS